MRDSTEFVSAVVGERAKRSRHYQWCTNSSWCSIRMYVYNGYRGTCANSGARHAYIMWAELGHSHFLYVPAV